MFKNNETTIYKVHYIYITTCLINNKKYIGQKLISSESISKLPNDGYFGSGTHLIKDLKKYGKNSFSKKIIAFASTQRRADEIEKQIISNCMAVDSDIFYNKAYGGQYHRDEKHSETMSALMKEVWKKDEYRKSKGLLTVSEYEEKKIKGMRIYLINTMKRVIKVKKLQEDMVKYGVNTHKELRKAIWRQGASKLTAYVKSEKHKAYLKNHNAWQKTPLGRQAMRNTLAEKRNTAIEKMGPAPTGGGLSWV